MTDRLRAQARTQRRLAGGREQARGRVTPASLARVTDTRQVGAPSPLNGRLSRYSLGAAVLAAVLIAAALVVLLHGGSSHAHGGSKSAVAHGSGSGSAAQTATQAASAAPGKQGAHAQAPPSAGGGKRVSVSETADPEEANSFPAPASVHHKAATTPSKASEEVVAAGAPSDAEVKHELAQMQAAEQTAKRAQKAQLTPVAGGNSVGGNGTIPIPTNVPEPIQRVIAGANAITDFPYVFGGGHASFVDNAYDCSGSVSYALAAAGLLSAPETSGELESWGAPGPGRYMTIYAAAGHVYMYVDGVMYNTAGRSGVYASRWQVHGTDNTGFVARHWPGL
jgi:cell wall-associated NlpC family hydrolase